MTKPSKRGALLAILLFLSQSPAWAGWEPDFPRLVEAVGKAENSIKYPYGVKSINTRGNVAYARQIALNSARNAWGRYLKARGAARRPISGDLRPFLDEWGARWCPGAADAKGNRVWAKNVMFYYERGA